MSCFLVLPDFRDIRFGTTRRENRSHRYSEFSLADLNTGNGTKYKSPSSTRISSLLLVPFLEFVAKIEGSEFFSKTLDQKFYLSMASTLRMVEVTTYTVNANSSVPSKLASSLSW